MLCAAFMFQTSAGNGILMAPLFSLFFLSAAPPAWSHTHRKRFGEDEKPYAAPLHLWWETITLEAELMAHPLNNPKMKHCSSATKW